MVPPKRGVCVCVFLWAAGGWSVGTAYWRVPRVRVCRTSMWGPKACAFICACVSALEALSWWREGTKHCEEKKKGWCFGSFRLVFKAVVWCVCGPTSFFFADPELRPGGREWWSIITSLVQKRAGINRNSGVRERKSKNEREREREACYKAKFCPFRGGHSLRDQALGQNQVADEPLTVAVIPPLVLYQCGGMSASWVTSPCSIPAPAVSREHVCIHKADMWTRGWSCGLQTLLCTHQLDCSPTLKGKRENVVGCS